MRNKAAFTLIEVLVAVVILFTAGFALMRLYDQAARKAESARQKARLFFVSTPLLFSDPHFYKKRRVTADRLVRFKRLRDDEILFLRNLTLHGRLEKSRVESLYEGLDYRIQPVAVQREKSEIRMIRVLLP